MNDDEPLPIDPTAASVARLYASLEHRLAVVRPRLGAPLTLSEKVDLLGLPLLVKTRGKTTTDQISPAGEWLRLRGHLEKFSDNLLSGANDAAGGAPGTAADPATGERRAISAIARSHRARGVRWVIVGDANYGEGSSREHAALSPRLLGCAAVVARSFARIHESNLKKQGVLALTFADGADYDRVHEGDQLDLVDLDSLAPGAPVRAVLHHQDGTTETLALRHSYGATQLAWWRAGSALNARPSGRLGA